MSKLQELIQRLCPDGVEYKTIEQIGSFYGGLTGKSKEDFVGGNAKFITYLNIYTNPSLSLDIKDRVRVAFGENQNIVKYGDILFTGSSETPDECGMSSVLTQYTNEPLYLNSFCFGLRLESVSAFNLDFIKHLFRSVEVRKQIAKTANGVTRFNISKKLFAKIRIPIPPREVQDEIAKILDRFAVYAAELQAELQARKEQYEYYRNLLLTFNPTGCAGGADDEQEGSVTTWGGIVTQSTGKPWERFLKCEMATHHPKAIILFGIMVLFLGSAWRISEKMDVSYLMQSSILHLKQ